jgi:hypothetical protein
MGRWSFVLLGVGILLIQAIAPITSNAQATKPAASAEKKAKDSSEKKPSAGPFHGKLAAIDQNARTITVGKRTFQITSETKIHKAGKPATLADGVVGEETSGYVKPLDEGKWVATTVNFGPKVESKSAEKKPAPKTK